MRLRLATCAVLALLSGCGDGSDSGRPKKAQDAKSPSAAKTDAEASCATLLNNRTKGGMCKLGNGSAVTAPLGKPVALDDTKIRVLSVMTAKTLPDSSGELGVKTAQGRYVILTLKVSNMGSRPLDWGNSLDGRATLILGDKNFDHDGDAESNIPSELEQSGVTIPPDGSASRTLVFDVTDPARKKFASQGNLAFVSTSDLVDKGLDSNTASRVGLVRLPAIK